MAVDFKKLIEQIVVPLVVSPDDVHVETLLNNEGQMHIKVLVNENDLGRVIGKGGKIAHAIRTILYAGATKEGIKVQLDIEANNN